ncbi:MAG TPA: hypothetical protein VIZ90_18040 [Rhizobiaceae bacterium]
MTNFGVIYVAFGAPYLAMALTSLLSLRVTNPTVPACIVTNVVPQAPTKPWWQPEIGDRWIFLDEETAKNRNAKTSVYQLSPFELTLFLDCDTMVLGDLSPLPGYLDYFDVLLSAVYNPDKHSKRRILDGKYRYTADGHFNSGVFAFKRNDAAEQFFSLWNERYNALGYRLDQPALVEAAYLSTVRIFPLPSKWNTGDKWLAASSIRNEIVVWHYKVRMEPLVERLVRQSVEWFCGDNRHLDEIEYYLALRRKLRHARSASWWIRRGVTRMRGDQSRRLETHPNREKWRKWTGTTECG